MNPGYFSFLVGLDTAWGRFDYLQQVHCVRAFPVVGCWIYLWEASGIDRKSVERKEWLGFVVWKQEQERFQLLLACWEGNLVEGRNGDEPPTTKASLTKWLTLLCWLGAWGIWWVRQLAPLPMQLQPVEKLHSSTYQNLCCVLVLSHLLCTVLRRQGLIHQRHMGEYRSAGIHLSDCTLYCVQKQSVGPWNPTDCPSTHHWLAYWCNAGNLFVRNLVGSWCSSQGMPSQHFCLWSLTSWIGWAFHLR
jgi:hypothetical protein